MKAFEILEILQILREFNFILSKTHEIVKVNTSVLYIFWIIYFYFFI